MKAKKLNWGLCNIEKLFSPFIFFHNQYNKFNFKNQIKSSPVGRHKGAIMRSITVLSTSKSVFIPVTQKYSAETIPD